MRGERKQLNHQEMVIRTHKDTLTGMLYVTVILIVLCKLFIVLFKLLIVLCKLCRCYYRAGKSNETVSLYQIW